MLQRPKASTLLPYLAQWAHSINLTHKLLLSPVESLPTMPKVPFRLLKCALYMIVKSISSGFPCSSASPCMIP